MRTYITVFVITALLVLFIVGEKFYVGRFCREFTNDIKKIESYVTESNIAEKYIDKIINNWEKQKKAIFVFANHNSFEKIETGIYHLEYSIKSEKYDDVLFYTNELYHWVDEMVESTKLSPGNLL